MLGLRKLLYSHLMGGYDDPDSTEYLIPDPLLTPMFDSVGTYQQASLY